MPIPKSTTAAEQAAEFKRLMGHEGDDGDNEVDSKPNNARPKTLDPAAIYAKFNRPTTRRLGDAED